MQEVIGSIPIFSTFPFGAFFRALSRDPFFDLL